jgi:micrococcal nuclease
MERYDAAVRHAPAVLLSLLAVVLLCAPGSAEARRPKARGAPPVESSLELAGERVDVRWTDGDTFKILSGAHRGRGARLAGVNALETFGPVHRFGVGDGGAASLLELAKQSAALAAAAARRCELEGKPDRYGRLVVSCPDAAAALVRAGHAMVFAVDREPDEALVALQRAAQGEGVGMWTGVTPPHVPTSLHSEDEPDLGRGGAYDRIADTRTGRTEVRRHGRRYRSCEQVCVGDGPERACLVYVPYALRYRNRPACLR